MATIAANQSVGQLQTASAAYERFAGACAILVGVLTFVYSVSFIVLRNGTLSSFCLLVNGLLSTAVLVALYERVRSTNSSFALWGLLLGVAGAIGTAVHGGFDLAGILHAHGPVDPDLPSPMDPRGLLTFGATGVAVWVFAWLIVRGEQLPRMLGYLGYVVAVLSTLLYLGRLVIFDAASLLIVIPAVLAGFLATPIWNVWIGITLWRGGRA